jgi:hypothetical protein
MNDRPTAAELVEAVRLLLQRELVPALTDQRLKFQALVAANVLAVAGREMALEAAMLAEEREALRPFVGDAPADVLSMNERLCARIRAGEIADEELRPVLRRLVARKLEVANPGFRRDPAARPE